MAHAYKFVISKSDASEKNTQTASHARVSLE